MNDLSSALYNALTALADSPPKAPYVSLLHAPCVFTRHVIHVTACSFSAGGMRIPGTILEKEFLPDDFMRQWVHNFTTVLSFVKVCSGTLYPFLLAQLCSLAKSASVAQDVLIQPLSLCNMSHSSTRQGLQCRWHPMATHKHCRNASVGHWKPCDGT